MSACVKYWYLPRRVSGISMKSMWTGTSMAVKTAVARSFQVRAMPVPQLKRAAGIVFEE